MTLTKRVFLIIAAASCFFPATGVYADTIFLANFDEGYQAVFSEGEGTPLIAADMPEGTVRLVDGKFGGGLFVERDAPALALSYATRDNFRWEEGTLEFWFRPEWTMADREEFRGREMYKMVRFFETSSDPTRFSLNKNQHNWLSWDYRQRYVTRGRASIQYSATSDIFSPGTWTHVAASWDKTEARLFVDGHLVAVSDEWNIPGAMGGRMSLGSRGYGSGLAANGTFDDFRISGHQRYISSFIKPAAPLTADKAIPEPRAPAPSASEIQAWEKQRTMFFTDFRHGLAANFSRGRGAGRSNHSLPCEEKEGRTAVRLQRRQDMPGDTLWFPLQDNVNMNMGAVEVSLYLSDEAQLPAVIFDTSRIVRNPGNTRDSTARTGTRLLLDDRQRLVWECLETGRVISSVASAPLDIKRGTWHRLGAAWGNGLRIYMDGKKVAEAVSVPLPSMTGNYFFAGSDSRGAYTLDGWLDSVEIRLWNTLDDSE